jgi:hypothetical protein
MDNSFFKKKGNFLYQTFESISCVVPGVIYSSFILIPLLSFYIADIISGLVIHSTISFNAANFFSLSIFSLTGFIIICILLYIWLFITGLLVKLASFARIHYFWQYILIAACSFLLISIHVFLCECSIVAAYYVYCAFAGNLYQVSQ